MNKQQIEDVLKEALVVNECNLRNNMADELEEAYHWGGSDAKQPTGYKITAEAQFGGEGQGDQYWLVLGVTNTTTQEHVYVRFNGWYDSYAGHEYYNGFDLVRPKMVQVTEWEETKD